MTKTLDAQTVIAHTRCWIERAVVGMNLCPFARKPFEGEQVRYVVSDARDPETLFTDLQEEFEYLRATDPTLVETTVLIHPWVLNDFLDYNDFLDAVDALLEEGGYGGEFQVASLHPQYQFAGTDEDEAQNYTNRSPYPILHLLREQLLEQALASYPDPENIPERNIATMERVGSKAMQQLLAACTHADDE